MTSSIFQTRKRHLPLRGSLARCDDTRCVCIYTISVFISLLYLTSPHLTSPSLFLHYYLYLFPFPLRAAQRIPSLSPQPECPHPLPGTHTHIYIYIYMYIYVYQLLLRRKTVRRYLFISHYPRFLVYHHLHSNIPPLIYIHQLSSCLFYIAVSKMCLTSVCTRSVKPFCVLYEQVCGLLSCS